MKFIEIGNPENVVEAIHWNNRYNVLIQFFGKRMVSVDFSGKDSIQVFFKSSSDPDHTIYRIIKYGDYVTMDSKGFIAIIPNEEFHANYNQQPLWRTVEWECERCGCTEKEKVTYQKVETMINNDTGEEVEHFSDESFEYVCYGCGEGVCKEEA